MSHSFTVKRPFHVRRRARLHKAGRPGALPPHAARVPRLARLMALAIRFDDLIRSGEVNNQAELARLGHVSRARITQIMNLVLLAPDVQESLLFLSQDGTNLAGLRLSQLQPITHIYDWREQRQLWAALGLN